MTGAARPQVAPRLKHAAKRVVPPVLWDALRSLRQADDYERRYGPEWEYVPGHSLNGNPKIKGWNVEGVVAKHVSVWDDFVRLARSTEPMAMTQMYEGANSLHYGAHNTCMSFAYVLALASRRRDQISLLDWGGGIGEYSELAKALFEDLAVDYHCRELPLLVRKGRALNPSVHFYDDDSCFDRQYDLVMASGSLNYSQDWERVLGQLAQSAGRYLYVARLPTVVHSESFVVVQRPYAVGYDTEYAGWWLNRRDFLSQLERNGMTLIREFINFEEPYIRNAPERPQFRSFLFGRASAVETLPSASGE